MPVQSRRAAAAWLLVTASLLSAQDTSPLKPLPSFLRTPKVAERYLSTRDVAEVMQFERKEPVCLQLIQRPNVPQHVRAEAAAKLAELRGTTATREILPWVRHWDQIGADQDEVATDVLTDLAPLLAGQAAADLAAERDAVKTLAETGRRPAARRAALAALMVADGGPAAAWNLAQESPDRRADWVMALGWLPADLPREPLEPLLRPLAESASDDAVRRAAIEQIGSLGVRPRETFELLASLLQQAIHPAACVRGLERIPQESWLDDQRQPVVEAVLAYVADLPLERRSTVDAKLALALVAQAAESLPEPAAAAARRQIAALTLLEVTITTLEEKMAYNRTVLVVQAGQGVQIRLENHDIMPHNLVVVDSPQAREEVGIAADQMQTEPDALARGYLPRSPHILQATRLIQPRAVDLLTFTAPRQSGTYAYLCTFPGHWSKMYGALLVVDDLAEYTRSHPVLPAADELLGIRTVDWTWEQLSAMLADFSQPRSFANGQRQFLKSSCLSCHRMGQEGGRIGPELTAIREKYKTPEELLRQIALPSDKVEEKYATAIVELDTGEILRGVVVNETETELLLNDNPLTACEPKVVNKRQIEALTRSQLSPMPEKLLNGLVEPRDILDLLAYVLAGGDPAAPVYRP